LEVPEKLHSKSLPKFKCGMCKVEIVEKKEFRNMDKYGCICKKCANILSKEKREEKILATYGVRNPNDIPGNAEKKREIRELNHGKDEIKINAANMINHRWEKEKEKSLKIEKEGKQCCNVCNTEKTLEHFTFKMNRLRGHKTYRKICKLCHNKKRSDKRNEENKNNSLQQCLLNILDEAKRREKKKKKGFDITLEYLSKMFNDQNGKCYYSGRQMRYNWSKEDFEGKRICPERISIDRIDSNKGYIQGNVVLCCWVANNIKQDLSVEEFNSIIKDIYNNFSSK